MKVLVADKLVDLGLNELKKHGCEVVYDPTLTGDALRDAIAHTGCAVLIVRSTPVTEAMLDASTKLNVVIRAGAGYNTIDVTAASRRSILVANCPGKNAVAVAELTFALILALDRRIVENVVDLRNGVWNKKEYSIARGIKGRTLGVIGLGQIGKAVVRRAHAFGMPVVAWSRSLDAETAEALGVDRCESVKDVAARCDVLTIHLAAAPETKGLVDADVLNALAPGSYVVNTSRADVLDYESLANAIETKRVRVGLDVYPSEPGASDCTFADTIVRAGGVVYGMHHIGASTEQAQAAIATETVRIVREYVQTGRVENCVNLSARSTAQCVVVVRHRNRPGVLAHALNVIREAGINVEEMQNVICDGGESASAQIKLSTHLPEETARAIEADNEHVLGVSVFDVAD